MNATTSTIPIGRRREISPIAAALLTVAGNMLVIAIAAATVAGVIAAAVLVFGADLLGLG